MTHLRLRVGKVSILLAFIWLLACPLSASAGSPRERSAARPGNFISLSDLHFDPFYDASLFNCLNKSDYRKWKAIFSSAAQGYSTYGDDTNYNLLNSAIEYAGQVSPHPDFVIISGDFLAHDFQQKYYNLAGQNDFAECDCDCPAQRPNPAAACPAVNPNLAGLEDFTDKTLAFVTLLIEERFPNTPVYPALGNNDSYSGDYNLAPNSCFLTRTAQTWKRLIKGRSNTASFLKTFPRNGSYTVKLPGGNGQFLIVLNTVFLSRDYNNCCNAQPSPDQDELSWFEAQLRQASASKQKVWLLSHIPPGVNVYLSLDGGPVTFYKDPPDNQRFLRLMTRYSPLITYSFAGHTHMDSFQLVNRGIGETGSVVFITPAISPRFKNNPGFKVFTYDRQKFSLIDYSTYYLNLMASCATWGKEYSFNATYGQTSIDPHSLQDVYLRLNPNIPGSYYFNLFSKFYNVSDTDSPQIDNTDNKERFAYWCGIGYLTPEQFTHCQLRAVR